jgi:hypothetical protein
MITESRAYQVEPPVKDGDTPELRDLIILLTEAMLSDTRACDSAGTRPRDVPADHLMTDPCGRCFSGNGFINAYRHVAGGVCFGCGGLGGMWQAPADVAATIRRRAEESVAKEARRAKAAAAKARKLERQRAAAKPLIDALVDAHPLLAELTYPQQWMGAVCHDSWANRLGGMESGGGWVADIARKLMDTGRLTERQISAVENVIRKGVEIANRKAAQDAQRAAEKAAATPAPTGRVTVTGKIVHLKWVEQNHRYGQRTTVKMLLKSDEGFTVWASMPSSLNRQVEQEVEAERAAARAEKRDPLPLPYSPEGRRVRVTLTLEPKADDPTFAFGARPANATVIDQVTPELLEELLVLQERRFKRNRAS